MLDVLQTSKADWLDRESRLCQSKQNLEQIRIETAVMYATLKLTSSETNNVFAITTCANV